MGSGRNCQTARTPISAEKITDMCIIRRNRRKERGGFEAEGRKEREERRPEFEHFQGIKVPPPLRRYDLQ